MHNLHRLVGARKLSQGLFVEQEETSASRDPPASGALLKSLALQSAKYLSVRGPMNRQNVWNQASDQVTGLCVQPLHAFDSICARSVPLKAVESCCAGATCLHACASNTVALTKALSDQ